MRIDELKDKPVMSIASGTKLGTVHDFLLDESYLQIAALVIGGGGLFGGHKQVVAYDAIHGIGPDAIMVNGEEVVEEVGDNSALEKAHALDTLRQQVMSESGVSLGHVVEIEFEPQTGALSGLCFAPQGEPEDGEVCDVLRDDIVSMTEKTVIVRHSVVEETTRELTPASVQDAGQVVNHEADRDAGGSASAAAGFEPRTTAGANPGMPSG